MQTINAIKAELAELNAAAKAHRNSHNAGGDGFNPYDSKIEDACGRLRQAELADYCARWSDIRTAWNAAVAKFAGAKGVSAKDLPKIEEAAGISLADIKIVKSMMEG